MKTNTAVKTRSAVKTGTSAKEFDKITFVTLSAVAICFGVFAFASIGGAIVTGGLGSMAKGWLVAVGMI